MKKIVLKLKWAIKQEYIDEQNMKEINTSLDILIHYHIYSLLNQTNQNYICFIEYHPSIEEILFEKIQKEQVILPSNIILTKEMRAEIRTIFTRDYLKVFSEILFVRMNQNHLYHKEFVDKLHQYNIPEYVRVIRMKEAYQYYILSKELYESSGKGQDFNNYVYVCDQEEYFKHFCIYDYYFPTILERNYQKMVNVYLEDRVLLTLKENIDTIKSQKTYQRVDKSNNSLILRNFIKEEV